MTENNNLLTQYMFNRSFNETTDAFLVTTTNSNSTITPIDIAMGNVPGYSIKVVHGINLNVTKDTTEDIWYGGGNYVFPTSAVITHLSQKVDQVDMRDGTIAIEGLNADWELVTQTQELDSSDTTTPVALTTPLIRIFSLAVQENFVTDQIITVHDSGNTYDYCIMPIGDNYAQTGIYTVPAGKTAYLSKYYAAVVESTGKEPISTRFKLWFANRDAGYEFQAKHSIAIPKSGDMVTFNVDPPGAIPQMTDIKITAYPVGDDGDVGGGFSMILVDTSIKVLFSDSCQFTNPSSYYILTEILEVGDVIFTDANAKIPAENGYYSDGSYTYRMTDEVIVDKVVCTTNSVLLSEDCRFLNPLTYYIYGSFDLLQVGDIIYSNSDGTIPVVNGTYSNGNNKCTVINGIIDSIDACSTLINAVQMSDDCNFVNGTTYYIYGTLT